jgi:hypothetical protein
MLSVMVIKTATEKGVTSKIAPEWKINLRETPNGWTSRLDFNHSDLIYDLGTYQDKDEAEREAEAKARTIVPANEQLPPPLTWSKFSTTLKVEETKPASRRQQLLAGLGLLVGIIATFLALTISFPGPSLTEQAQIQGRDISELKKLIEGERADIEGLRKVTVTGPSEIGMNQRIAQLENSLGALKERLANYEAAIGDEPAKKLAVPMLRKDMDTLRDEHKSDLTEIHNEMSRTFDLMKWLLGLLGVGSLVSTLGAGWFSRSSSAKG